MLGWEFPPFISGGLGTACFGLTKGLDRLDVRVLFVLPKPVASDFVTHVEIVAPGRPTPQMERRRRTSSYVSYESQNVQFRTIDAELRPYMRPKSAETVKHQEKTYHTKEIPGAEVPDWPGFPQDRRKSSQKDLTAGPGADYEGNLFDLIERYTYLVEEVCANEQFDLIHAHDWMTYRAGMRAAQITGKPLIAHIHSTEFDRSGLHVNQQIYDIERAGMQFATRVIAVSYLTKNLVLKHYGVDGRKVDVVYNAIDDNGPGASRTLPAIQRDEKIVLFLGRITMQKGPEYFLQAAKRVLDVQQNVRFIMAGSGDMVRGMIELATAMGIEDKVLFTGFLRGDDVQRVFRMADLYVMPSVSEPFGIAPLEALANDVPVLISKQSGVAEVIQHALKVDFWDVEEMANKIVAVLRHPPLQATLRNHGGIEVRRFSWTDAAECCLQSYRKAISGT